MPRGKAKKKTEEVESKPTGILDAIWKKLNKKYDYRAVQALDTDQDQEVTKVDSISTGSMSLDLATGIGGIPRGRMTEIFGDESTGKTTLGMHIVKEAQKLPGAALFIDAENGFDLNYGKGVGIDFSRSKFLLSQPTTAEEAFDIIVSLVRTEQISIVIVDSVAALEPKADADKEIDEVESRAILARFMSRTLRKVNPLLYQTKTPICFINQIRADASGYGSSRITPGGKALKFYAAIRIDLRRREELKQGDSDPYGIRVHAKVIKNKLAPPFRTAEFDLIFGKGISVEGEILDTGMALGLIEKSGAWYSIGTEKIGHGRIQVAEYFHENPDKATEMIAKIREMHV